MGHQPHKMDCSSERQAAIHGHDLASDEVGGGGEEKHGGGDLLASAVTAHGRDPGHAAKEVAFSFGFSEVDHAGSHAVDGDFGRQRFGHDFGEHVKRSFR